jgi:hypothetical protein
MCERARAVLIRAGEAAPGTAGCRCWSPSTVSCTQGFEPQLGAAHAMLDALQRSG